MYEPAIVPGFVMLPFSSFNVSSLHTVCRWHPSPSASAAAQMLHVENSHNIRQQGRQVPSCRCNELVTFNHTELFSLGLRGGFLKGLQQRNTSTSECLTQEKSDAEQSLALVGGLYEGSNTAGM
ncbi:hypothetical protein K470DRAFT_117384 [Piedraia hortae CBS 480.64]|uniref:Uncharacterized protein n=1 Tax=Piedraia hortae CBS 480.64 TaxID=1314780 RepID=A0A6A7BUH0_9PEZI|nr:hypothetical protein K470DRAFT_117384 [Piedraia hortae CBS 480.64]